MGVFQILTINGLVVMEGPAQGHVKPIAMEGPARGLTIFWQAHGLTRGLRGLGIARDGNGPAGI